MKQKLLLVVCSLLTLLNAKAIVFTATSDGKDIRYATTGETTCKVINGGDYAGQVVIPQTVTYDDQEYTVNEIANAAFGSCQGLTSVTIPSSVTKISDQAFRECTNLEAFYGALATADNRCLVYADTLKTFASAGLTTYDIPAGAKAIGPYCFYNCHSLNKITIPSTVEEIGSYAFSFCSALTSVEIPTSVTTILDHAFTYCESLETVEIPQSVRAIDKAAFSGDASLRAFYGKHSSADNRCLIVNGTLVAFAPKDLTAYAIPNTVTKIGDEAFCECSNLSSVTIPNSVKEVGDFAFYFCDGLSTIEIPASVTKLGGGAFFDCFGLTSVTLPVTLKTIGDSAFSNCESLTSIDIPASVTKINHFAFENCDNLHSVKVRNTDPANINSKNDMFYCTPVDACWLFVPKGSKGLYQTAEPWNGFANIVEFSEPKTFIDGEVYDGANDYECDVTYTRNFKNTEWQPLYVPFNMSYDEWSPYADVAEVHNVRGYDKDNDGAIDDIAIEFNTLRSGELVPNIPYAIRAKQKGVATFECTGKIVLAAPAEEGSVDCSSTKLTYSFRGIYQPKTDMYSSGVYHLSSGAFRRATTDAAVLSPFRFYLKITPKTNGYNTSTLPSKIKMEVDGEDVTDGIEGIEVDVEPDGGMYYDLLGRPVENPGLGVYILAGKKLQIR